MAAPSHSCGCRLHRRGFLRLAGGAALAAAFPLHSMAAPDPEALLVICTEPRVWQYANDYMKSRQLAGKYKPVEVEGGAIALVADHYQASHKASWDALMSATTWQQTRRIIALDHRGCVAAKTAYGVTKVSDRLIETETHRYALQEFRRRMAQRKAEVEVEIGLIGPDGKVEIFK